MRISKNNESNRGRPRGRQSHLSMSVLSSIAQIAVKYKLEPWSLFDAFTKAWTHEDSQCENLTIKCRKIDSESAIFLITLNNKVIWQFPIQIDILQKPELFKSCIPSLPEPVHKEGDSTRKHISELRNKMKYLNLKARIIEVPPKMLVSTRYGWEAYFSNVLLADTTGTIRLGLWNNQIDDVSVGDTIDIQKASVTTYYGQLQLRIGRKGTMSIDTSTRESVTI